MEPLDPATNDETSRFSKRRISSILKAPRKSIRLPDPEQQENVVECVKPGEKRNSRRVSFAPANDVLLFSNEVKNASSARSPLQDSTAAAATQNRVQVAVTEDGIQQITGMETLLNAPLHASQQRDKVNFDTGGDFGEKTVIFSTDDASMDMTHSHTINIAGDAELLADISLKNYDIFPSSREKSVMFAADDGSKDVTLSHTLNTMSASTSLLPTSRNMALSVERGNVSSSVRCLDPEFENFLASLSKPSGPSGNPVITRMTPPAEETNGFLAPIKTQRADVDKENQAPTSVSAVMEKSLNASRKIGAPSYGSTLHPEDDVGMDMTEAHTGRIQGFTDDDDDDNAFQCLFPTQEMYAHLENRVSQTAEKTKQQQNSKTLASFNTKDATSLKNPSLHASQQRHKVNLDRKDECREKTVLYTAGDDFMDMTRSHTVNIASGLEERKHEARGPSGSSANALDLGFKNFLASLSKPSALSGNPAASSRSLGESLKGGAICPERDVSMDMTEAQTGRVMGLALGSANSTGMETSLKPSSKTKVQRHQVNFDAEDDCREKTVRFSGDDACMDVTQSHTVNIAADFEQQPLQNVDFLPTCQEKTVRFTAGDGGMDMTQCLTVNIDCNLVSESVLPVKNQEGETCRPLRNRSSSAHALDPGFNNLFTSISKPSDPSGGTVCPEDDDVSMDMTEAQTGHILSVTGTDDLQSLLPTQDVYPQSGRLEKAETTSRQQHSETLRSSNRKGMETSLTASVKAKMHGHQVKFDAEDECREKTVRFSADDACMDVTRSHTVIIATNLEPQSLQNVDFLPACGEKTVRFSANDAAMDMTQCLTVNIASSSASDSVPPQQDSNILSSLSAKKRESETCRPRRNRSSSARALDPGFNNLFTSISKPSDPSGGTVCPEDDDVSMDMTEAQTGHILSVTGTDDLQSLLPTQDVYPQSGRLEKAETTSRQQHSETLRSSNRKGMETSLTASVKAKMQRHQVKFDAEDDCREKTVRFSADDACMDVTRSHTVIIATNLEPQSLQNVDFLPACGEKTVRFSANDAAMDMTQCLTVNIASSSASDSVPPQQDSNILSSLSAKKRESETCRPRRNRSSSARALDPGFKNSLSRMSGPWANLATTKAVAPAAPSPQETDDTNGVPDQRKTPDVDTEKEAPGFVSAVMEKPVNKTTTDCPRDDVSMDMTEAQTGHILGQTCADEPPQEATSRQSDEALGSSSPDGVEMTNRPDSLDSNETDTREEPKPRNPTSSLIQRVDSPRSAVDHDVGAVPSRKSRRMTLADVHSKVRRLSQMINSAPDTIAVDSYTAPLFLLDEDKTSKDKTKSLPVMEAELEMGLVNAEENTQAQCLVQEEQNSSSTTPFDLKNKQLLSRLSVGGFKPKLPQRSKPDDPKKGNSVGEHTRTMTLNVTNQLSNFDNDVSDIYDEELDSCDDMSEMLDAKRSPQKASDKVSPSRELNAAEPLQDHVFEQDFISAVYGNRRSLPLDQNNMEDEKRMKGSAETSTDFETGLQSHVVECDGNTTTAPSTTTQTSDDSHSIHTASVTHEATFESTFKQSLFESQLEDYANDVQRKVDDGTITVLEFFKLFNIDFVIHNPRQSVLPGRLLSDTDRTPMDLLKARHINRPKQMVYETNVLSLTEKVEGLMGRMQDLDKPLKNVNRTLWEEIRNSSEKELRSFGAKIKERNNLFRKTSKVQSHEMKEVLYSNLVQANLEEQQRLRGTIEEADEMIKSLDDCICRLETELTVVEEKGSEDTPSLKSLQEEMQKVTAALADNDRQISELEMQNKHNSNKVQRLKAETRNLESHVTVLHMIHEWRFGEKSDNRTVYTFLHETFHLQLVYEKPNGTDADHQSERKISHITFKHQLDDEKSQCHARLVHKVLSQYTDGKTAWVEKYPTSRHVPELLRDVGLVVSHCRLLGEELRLLKMWGGLRLDILNISCVDTRVHVLFSSLKRVSKFEVVFSVTLTNHLYVLQVQSFKNVIGSTTIQPIEEIVASFSPAKNLLTKIIKKIHENLLC